MMVEEPETQPEQVMEPEPVPVKEPPKPTKFSILQIKDLINEYSKEDKKAELEALVNPEVVSKVKEISSWKTDEVDVKFKEDPVKFNKKESRRDDNNQNKGNYAIKTGVRKDEAKEAARLGYKAAEETKVQIVVGAKETIETRQMKEKLKSNATDFVSLKMKEDEGLDKINLSRKEIVYNLNLIVPENLRDVEKDILEYLYDSEEVCKVLIEEIMKKAWDQPKYASTYAKLCSDFCKKNGAEFKFELEKKDKKDKKDSPFKYLLVDRVQHSFDEKLEKFPEF